MSEEQTSFLVTYDISSPKRWRKVYKTMHGYGRHVQLSVFLCDLTPVRYQRLLTRLGELIQHDEDQVILVKVAKSGSATVGRVESLGRKFVYHQPSATIV